MIEISRFGIKSLMFFIISYQTTLFSVRVAVSLACSHWDLNLCPGSFVGLYPFSCLKRLWVNSRDYSLSLNRIFYCAPFCHQSGLKLPLIADSPKLFPSADLSKAKSSCNVQRWNELSLNSSWLSATCFHLPASQSQKWTAWINSGRGRR